MENEAYKGKMFTTHAFTYLNKQNIYKFTKYQYRGTQYTIKP